MKNVSSSGVVELENNASGWCTDPSTQSLTLPLSNCGIVTNDKGVSIYSGVLLDMSTAIYSFFPVRGRLCLSENSVYEARHRSESDGNVYCNSLAGCSSEESIGESTGNADS